jgi:hypothetical protein
MYPRAATKMPVTIVIAQISSTICFHPASSGPDPAFGAVTLPAAGGADEDPATLLTGDGDAPDTPTLVAAAVNVDVGTVVGVPGVVVTVGVVGVAVVVAAVGVPVADPAVAVGVGEDVADAVAVLLGVTVGVGVAA